MLCLGQKTIIPSHCGLKRKEDDVSLKAESDLSEYFSNHFPELKANLE